MFIGRKGELNFLNEKYNSNKGELIVLYGRRRVGKTETLKEFSTDKQCVFYSCRECTDKEQLKSFSQRVLTLNIQASKYINVFNDWEQAFASILEFPHSKKRLLIIDEFPYMVRNNKSIPSILQNLWDNMLKSQNIMIILCGSAMSFMEKEILSEKNPLYGRATGILKMREMDFYDAVKFFPNYSNVDKILAYSILGGIPHYLNQFDSKKSIDENIKSSILQKGCILYSEVEFLMRQELREITIYNTIIEAIALGNTKLNDIFLKTSIEKSKIMVYLKNLISLGIIKREFSTLDGLKEQANVQRGLYKITDNFFSFWFAFVFPNVSELEAGDADGVYKYAVQPFLNEYTSRIYEDICIQYMRKQNMNNILPFRYVKIGRWWDKSNEIDVMAVDRNKDNFIIGECKFKDSKFTLSEMNSTLKKFNYYKENANIYYYLFSKSGFEDAVIKEAKTEGVNLISVGELLNEE